MALWNVNGKIVYSDGALSIANPPKHVFARRHYYEVPYSNVGKGAVICSNGVRYHVPSWTIVHPRTTLEDIIVKKKPFEELFVEPKVWEYKSQSSDKIYKVKLNKNDELSCSCWGYIAHRKCKHINETKLKIK